MTAKSKRVSNDPGAMSSALAGYLRSFLDFKRAQGHRYMQGDWFAPCLDRLMVERGDERITAATADAWMLDAATRGPNAACHRATFLRQFARYMYQFDKHTFQPPVRFVMKRPMVRPQKTSCRSTNWPGFSSVRTP